ncbi:hypothetical protein C8R45DRAFT_1095682 [Mycena sanguinolenta]|nr:hypothetical protein C8R45DRAFT_1095682 [Mycena sanguinolenta]
MPPIRQPLRDRCNVYLRVCTDRAPTSTKSKLPPHLVSSAGNTPPAPLEARRPLVASLPPLLAPVLDSPYVFVDAEEAAPRQFIPYLYLSSTASSASPAESTQLPRGNWTHAIRILPESEEHPAGSTSINTNSASATAASSSPQILDLYTLAVQPSGRALPLTKRHILVARDFLALALPYYASAHPTDDDSESDADSEPFLLSSSSSFGPPPTQRCRADPVRVLLMGPPRAILVVALTYIAYASECSVAHVMRCVVEEREDEESCELLGKDARMGLRNSQLEVLEQLAKKGL